MKKVILLIFIFFISCSSMRTKPEVSLVDLKMANATLFETNMVTQVRISNPNNRALNISGSKHRLKINGINIGTAVSNQALNIPALAERTQDLTFRISNLKVLSRIQGLIDSDAFEYEIESDLYDGSLFGIGTINSSTTGKYSF